MPFHGKIYQGMGAPAELRGACYLGPGKLKALPSSQAMAEAEARLPGEPTLVPAGRTGRRQGPAGDPGTDPGLGGVRGWNTIGHWGFLSFQGSREGCSLCFSHSSAFILPSLSPPAFSCSRLKIFGSGVSSS